MAATNEFDGMKESLPFYSMKAQNLAVSKQSRFLPIILLKFAEIHFGYCWKMVRKMKILY